MAADPARHTRVGAHLRRFFYRLFYRIPARWRRRLIRWFTPRYTLGALVLATDGQHRLLLVRHPASAQWSLPGGLMNRGEEPRTCAARELAEETGIRVDATALTAAHPNAIVHPDGYWVDMVFELQLVDEVTALADGIEIVDAAFHALDALPPMAASTAHLLASYGLGSGRPPAGYR